MGRANKPRKWSNLRGQLPEDDSQQLTERFKKVLEETDARRTHADGPRKGEAVTMQDLQDEWIALEEEEAFAELAASERSIKFDALERCILKELEKVKTVAGTDMWRGEGKTFSPKYTPRPTVTDPAALLKWIKDTGQEDSLSLPAPRLKSIVCEALDTEAAAVMTVAERAALKPGDPASGAPPPGVKVYLDTSVHHTTVKKGTPARPDDDDGPF